MPHDVCPWRYAYLFDNPVRRLFHNPVRLLEPYVVENMTVLDVGCGMGFFSIGMARLVGPKGVVHSVDLQQEMLDVLKRRAKRKGVVDRIRTHRCSTEQLGVDVDVDFILGFWMMHEVPNQTTLLNQLRVNARPECKLLIAEPKIHVTTSDLCDTIEIAGQAGWEYLGSANIRLSHSALFAAGTSTAD